MYFIVLISNFEEWEFKSTMYQSKLQGFSIRGQEIKELCKLRKLTFMNDEPFYGYIEVFKFNQNHFNIMSILI